MRPDVNPQYQMMRMQQQQQNGGMGMAGKPGLVRAAMANSTNQYVPHVVTLNLPTLANVPANTDQSPRGAADDAGQAESDAARPLRPGRQPPEAGIPGLSRECPITLQTTSSRGLCIQFEPAWNAASSGDARTGRWW